MTSKQNPVQLDAYACIHHAAEAGIPISQYIARVEDFARKRVKMIGKGLQ